MVVQTNVLRPLFYAVDAGNKQRLQEVIAPGQKKMWLTCSKTAMCHFYTGFCVW